MNTKELAAALNGIEYPPRIMRELTDAAKQYGLVIVYGQSDDIMTFSGAIDDDLGANDGTTAFVDAKGLIPHRESLDRDDDEVLREYFAREPHGKPIEALWAAEGDYSWTFKTDIPHETFEIVEDGEPYCRGIVFALADVGKKAIAAPLSTEPVVCWSTREEDGYSERFAEIVDGLAVGDVVYKGIRKDWAPTDFVSDSAVDCVIDQMASEAEDEAGEWADGFPNASPEARAELLAAIEAWADKHCSVDFWTVENIERHVLTQEDIDRGAREREQAAA